MQALAKRRLQDYMTCPSKSTSSSPCWWPPSPLGIGSWWKEGTTCCQCKSPWHNPTQPNSRNTCTILSKPNQMQNTIGNPPHLPSSRTTKPLYTDWWRRLHWSPHHPMLPHHTPINTSVPPHNHNTHSLHLASPLLSVPNPPPPPLHTKPPIFTKLNSWFDPKSASSELSQRRQPKIFQGKTSLERRRLVRLVYSLPLSPIAVLTYLVLRLPLCAAVTGCLDFTSAT